MKTRIYLCRWRYFNSDEIHNRILTVYEPSDLFDYFVDGSESIVEFAYTDISDRPIEEVEREVLYNARYAL